MDQTDVPVRVSPNLRDHDAHDLVLEFHATMAGPLQNHGLEADDHADGIGFQLDQHDIVIGQLVCDFDELELFDFHQPRSDALGIRRSVILGHDGLVSRGNIQAERTVVLLVDHELDHVENIVLDFLASDPGRSPIAEGRVLLPAGMIAITVDGTPAIGEGGTVRAVEKHILNELGNLTGSGGDHKGIERGSPTTTGGKGPNAEAEIVMNDRKGQVVEGEFWPVSPTSRHRVHAHLCGLDTAGVFVLKHRNPEGIGYREGKPPGKEISDAYKPLLRDHQDDVIVEFPLVLEQRAGIDPDILLVDRDESVDAPKKIIDIDSGIVGFHGQFRQVGLDAGF